MATATITWIPTSGSNYEIWYAKLSVVGSTSLPPDSGWTQASGSPFASTLGTATINGLDDNTQYRIATRNDCTSLDSAWSSSTKFKLDCPTFSLVANPVSTSDVGASITATINLVNLVEFEAITSSITLTVTKTSDSSIAATKVFTSPYDSSTLATTFLGLLATTGYTVVLTMQDAAGTVTCDSHNITTQTPVVIPPPTCTAPTFTIGSITTTTLIITITSSVITGDTFSVSLDGGVTYVTTAPTVPINIGGLLSGTSYQIVVRRNCVGGGQGISTSQTISTLVPSIVGAISLNVPSAFQQGTVTVMVTFPQPTPAPLTLYLGYTWENRCNLCSGFVCTWSNGYDIFPQVQSCPPSSSGGPIAADSQGDSFSGPPHLPFVVNVPQGVTTFTATNIYTTLGNPGPSGGVIAPWQYSDPNPGGGRPGQVRARGYIDLYVHIQNPSGYTSAFTMNNGQNVTGVTIHNV